MLAPRHLIFSRLEGALTDARTGSFAAAEDALSELERRHIAWILLTSRTRAEIEPIRRKLGHNHPFITESGGGIFFPDGYFNIKIPKAVRTGRYLSIAVARPYEETCSALDEVAEECSVGVAGYHHMSAHEVADNTGLRLRDAELARSREFDEPFFFTAADDAAIQRFLAAATARGFQAVQGDPFWRLCGGCDTAAAVRTVAKLFRESTHNKLKNVGVGSGAEDVSWLRAMDHSILLPNQSLQQAISRPAGTPNIATGGAPGPQGWNAAVLNAIA